MSATSLSSDNSNQFIRPKFDLHSAAVRMTSRGEGFANSIEFSNANSGGVPAEFTDALWEALVDCSDPLGSNNLCAIVNLYNGVLSTHNEADADPCSLG